MAEPNTALAKKDTIDLVEAKIKSFQNTGELHFPQNYSPENALKSAWLTIQEVVDRDKKPALSVCSRESVANALLSMVIQGLNPDKKQCYFIVYGPKLTLQRSYFGSIAVAKRVDDNIADIYPAVVYKGDVFKYRKIRGRDVVVEHEQTLENVNKQNIVAAYATVYYKDGTEASTIMTIDEIKQSWRQSKAFPFDDKGNLKPDSTHAKFPADMAMRTVVNKACKPIINSSDDSNLIVKFAKMTQDYQTEAMVEEEISDNANSEVIEVEYEADPATGEVIDAPALATEFDGHGKQADATAQKPAVGKGSASKPGDPPY